MDGVAVKPLTVDFHEGGFLDNLNQENKLGFWFQLSDDEKEQAGNPWGPENPQALNRYSYVQNNPLRWTDPTGHSLGGITKDCKCGGGGNGGPVGPSEGQSSRIPASNRATFEQYTKQLRRDMQKPLVRDRQLQDILDDLYRPNAQVGSGSTADAIRYELATGGSVGGRSHLQKGRDYIRALGRWVKNNPTASPGDRSAAENVIKDLSDAYKTRLGDKFP